MITDQDAKENTNLQEFRVNIERAVEYLLQCKSLHFTCYDNTVMDAYLLLYMARQIQCMDAEISVLLTGKALSSMYLLMHLETLSAVDICDTLCIF